jgi:chemotaxis methyl-accepting protein methylase
MDIVADREFNFHARDFARVRALIYDRAGISLHEGKQAMVYSRLSRRLRETGHRLSRATCSGWKAPRAHRPSRSGRSSSIA